MEDEDKNATSVADAAHVRGILETLDALVASDEAARERWTDWPEVAVVVERTWRAIADSVAQHAMIRELGLEIALTQDNPPLVPSLFINLGTNATPLDRPGESTHHGAYLEMNPVMSGKIRVAATGFALILHDREHPPSERCLLGVYDPIELLDEALVRHIAEQFFRLALASHWSANHHPIR